MDIKEITDAARVTTSVPINVQFLVVGSFVHIKRVIAPPTIIIVITSILVLINVQLINVQDIASSTKR